MSFEHSAWGPRRPCWRGPNLNRLPNLLSSPLLASFSLALALDVPVLEAEKQVGQAHSQRHLGPTHKNPS